MPDGPYLKHHHTHRVRDDVVELARDPSTLLRHCDARRRISLALGLGRAPFRDFGLVGALAQGVAGEPADREQERNEEELRRSVVRAVVDDDRGAADHGPEAQPRLHGVAKVAEQEGGDQARDGDARRERDEPSVDERECRADQPDGERHREREPAAPEQRKHEERGRGHDEPQGGVRSVRRVVSNDDHKGGLDRRDQDQGVESVPARSRPEAAHAVNVLQPTRPRLLPK